jgi:poly(3-hydroxybutyrate) depolymerase
MHKTRHGFRAAICLCAIAASSTAQVDVSSTLQHEGLTRSYIVRLPPGFSPDQRLPLVVALHPSVSSGADFKATSGWDAVSDLHGCVVAYPTGGNPVGTNGKYAWNSWDFSGAAPNDVSFLSALVARIQQDHGTDPCRTTMTGFSNGAMMTNSFAAVHPDKLAAIAPVSGGWITAYGGSETQLSPALPVAAWIWRGSNETFVTGVGANARPRDQQDQEQLAFWTSHDHALFASTQSEDLTYGLTRTYITNRYVGNAPVWFTEVQGTGHLYQPGAAELIWTRFFAPATAPTPACDPCGNFTSFCHGDGLGTACPCGNASSVGADAGCLNSLGVAGTLGGCGRASLASDTVVLSGSGMPNSSALYFQGTQRVSGGAGLVFGDGLRCAGGSVVRLGTTTNNAGASTYPSPGQPSLSSRGLVAMPGTRTYQVWYRNSASFCTTSTFNLTNGVEVVWIP